MIHNSQQNQTKFPLTSTRAGSVPEDRVACFGQRLSVFNLTLSSGESHVNPRLPHHASVLWGCFKETSADESMGRKGGTKWAWFRFWSHSWVSGAHWSHSLAVSAKVPCTARGDFAGGSTQRTGQTRSMGVRSEAMGVSPTLQLCWWPSSTWAWAWAVPAPK